MMDLENQANRVLRETFGHDEFRLGQKEVIDSLVAGQHVLAVMPTGSGKSLCYQIPALLRGGLTLVVSPLIALMEDQVAALRLSGVPADAINSSRSREENLDIWHRARRRANEGEPSILYLSPEKLMEGRMLEIVCMQNVQLVVIDEAHCISKWGPSFRPDYEALAELSTHLPDVPIGAFTATADETTRDDIMSKLFRRRGKLFVASFDRPNIHLCVEINNGKKSTMDRIVDFAQSHAGQSGVVYCLSRKDTEKMADELIEVGISALPYHAGMSTAERSFNQDEFMTRPGMVMVATIAFGMGVDKPDIRYVIHATIPGSVEAYYQELGRAGRDGEPAEALMLYGIGDVSRRRSLIDSDSGSSRQPERNGWPEAETEESWGWGNGFAESRSSSSSTDIDDHLRREHKRLDALVGYCESAKCRRQVLLGYFGEVSEPCGNCDLCENPPNVLDGSDVAQKVLEAVLSTGGKRFTFGQAHIIDVLRGMNNEKVRKFEHSELVVYGSCADYDKHELLSIIRQLVAGGFLEIDYKGYGGLLLTDRSENLMDGTVSFHYRRDAVAPKKDKTRRAVVSHEFNAMVNKFSEQDSKLFNLLKDLRLVLARERQVPAYIIFHDRTLVAMVARRPKTISEFASIPGVGQAKLTDFADVFTELIRAFEE